jgi:hypothetical protein
MLYYTLGKGFLVGEFFRTIVVVLMSRGNCARQYRSQAEVT